MLMMEIVQRGFQGLRRFPQSGVGEVVRYLNFEEISCLIRAVLWQEQSHIQE